MENEIKELQTKRLELVEALIELDHDANKVEVYEIHGEIGLIDQKLHAISPTLV